MKQHKINLLKNNYVQKCKNEIYIKINCFQI